MRIVEKILDILNSMDGVQTVLHESPSYTNIKIDRSPAPYAILYLLTDMEIDLSKGYAVDGCDVEVFFADLVKLDADGPTHQAVVDRMVVLARRFVSLLLADRSMTFGDKVELKTAYGRYDKNVTGVSLSLHVDDRQGECIDGTEPQTRTLEITSNGEYDVIHYGKAVVSVPSHGVVLQDKTARENGVVTPDPGYDGLQSVTVEVECPTPQPPRLQEKTATANGYVTYDSGFDGLQGVNVQVECPAPEVRLQTKTAVSNGFVTYDEGFDGLQGVNVLVPPPVLSLQDKSTDENGLVTADEGYDGLRSVMVRVPQPHGSTYTVIEENGASTVDVKDYETIDIETRVPQPHGNTSTTIRENTTTVVDVTDYVSINIITEVPAPPISLQTKTATANGFVTYDEGFDGLQGVNVQVPQPSGSTSLTVTDNNTTTTVDVTAFQSISVTTSVPTLQTWTGTTAQYQALAPNYDNNTLYLLTD